MNFIQLKLAEKCFRVRYRILTSVFITEVYVCNYAAINVLASIAI